MTDTLSGYPEVVTYWQDAERTIPAHVGDSVACMHIQIGTKHSETLEYTHLEPLPTLEEGVGGRRWLNFAGCEKYAVDKAADGLSSGGAIYDFQHRNTKYWKDDGRYERALFPGGPVALVDVWDPVNKCYHENWCLQFDVTPDAGLTEPEEIAVRNFSVDKPLGIFTIDPGASVISQGEAFAILRPDGTYEFNWDEIARLKDLYLEGDHEIGNAHAALLWYARNSP